jgi:hypothetical protein
MKKIIFLILFFSLSCPSILFSEAMEPSRSVKTENFLSDYRFDPFQWVFPEYFYKADIVPVQKEKTPPKGYTKVNVFGLTANIPFRYTETITRKHDILTFKSNTNDKIIMIKATNESFYCFDEKLALKKDYCSAYKTPQELFYKLFTLTPEKAESIGEKWIVHDKGREFDNVKKIKIYSDDMFMAYVKYIKDSLILQTEYSHEITLFHANGPLNCYVNIRFNEKDDTVLNHFISSIE